MARTFGQLTSDVIRETRGQADTLEAQQSLKDALNLIDSKANWEFLLQRALINLEAPYSTGTVSVSGGATAVTGVGTTWSAAWNYKTIKFKSHTIPYDISFSGATTGTLAGALAGSTAIAGETYKVYQGRYALPADCEPGRELSLSGPLTYGPDGDGTMSKIVASRFERYDNPQFQTAARPIYWTDGPYDEVNSVATIRIQPYPSVAQELQLLYYKKLTVPTTASARVMIPEAFERLPILMAAWPIMKRRGMPGWMENKQEAIDMMGALYSRHAAAPAYDNQIEVHSPFETPTSFASDSLLYTAGE